MAFLIEPLELISFIKDPKIKLPRFQRKATWTDSQKFQLCISVFKGYPVGVVIYNCSNKKDGPRWLLDGRQRRNALKTAWENPVNVYHYAQQFLKFKNTCSPDDIRTLFWNTVNSFLQKDKSGEDNTVLDLDSENETDEYANDIDPEEQKGNLQTLLSLILMVHSIKKNVSEWEKRFDFLNYVHYLPYVQNGRVDPRKLKSFLLEWDAEHPNGSFEQFSDTMSQFPLKEGITREKFKEHLEHAFDTLKNNIKTLREAEDIFSEARIGVISLRNVTPLDAQNIFSLVNSGGTQLKAEELLSAKPFWNIPVSNQLLDFEVRRLVQNLYKDLNIPGEDSVNTSDVVRWDICATLLDRIDKNHLFFPSFKQYNNDINMTKIALGFKLASAEVSKGISSKHIEKMELCQNWEDMIQSLIHDVNKISEILLDVNFYHNLNGWKKSIYDLMGSAITLEFITILRKKWTELGKPTVESSNRKSFIHNSLILLDKLLFEYSNNQWRGSGDSKMAHDVENISERLIQTPDEDWNAFIRNACKSNANYKRLEPVLYYFAVLQQKQPDSVSQVTYDIDHIVPQTLLDSQTLKIDGIELSSLKDTLGNLALLPHKSNIKKSEKTLRDIEKDLKKEVSRYTDIGIDDFEKFSDITNLPELCNLRKDIFLEIVNKKRINLFANNKLI